jgi:hypothetical protein
MNFTKENEKKKKKQCPFDAQLSARQSALSLLPSSVLQNDELTTSDK